MTPRGRLRYAVSMARYTSWRVGGPAERFYEPADIEDLGDFLAGLEESEPVIWLGLGSNLLVRDGGIRGTVVAVAALPDELIRLNASQLRISAGTACAKVARFSAEQGLAGAEFLAGIPGTLGGALAMNAGAFGGNIWSIVTQVETLDRHGQRHRRPPTDFTVAYRSVAGPAGEWFVRAVLELKPDLAGEAAARIRELLSLRAASQPMGQPSCGSVFKNPPGDHAARLIEACGLKGKRVGAAQISDKHANFIVNLGGARAADIETLIGYAQDQVRARFGILLEPEVRIVGEPAAEETAP
jgi:UDP-N-acetylmuramate dehydrogenase